MTIRQDYVTPNPDLSLQYITMTLLTYVQTPILLFPH